MIRSSNKICNTSPVILRSLSDTDALSLRLIGRTTDPQVRQEIQRTLTPPIIVCHGWVTVSTSSCYYRCLNPCAGSCCCHSGSHGHFTLCHLLLQPLLLPISRSAANSQTSSRGVPGSMEQEVSSFQVRFEQRKEELE